MLYQNYLIIYLLNLILINAIMEHPFQIGNNYLMYQIKSSRMHSLKYYQIKNELVVHLIK